MIQTDQDHNKDPRDPITLTNAIFIERLFSVSSALTQVFVCSHSVTKDCLISRVGVVGRNRRHGPFGESFFIPNEGMAAPRPLWTSAMNGDSNQAAHICQAMAQSVAAAKCRFDHGRSLPIRRRLR